MLGIFKECCQVLVLQLACCCIIVSGFRSMVLNGVSTVYAVENEEAVIDCQSDNPMAYCGLTHPNGSKFLAAGLSKGNGQCFIRQKITRNDSGTWTCRLGQENSVGVETMTKVNVVVSNKLAPLVQNTTVTPGSAAILACITAEGLFPLQYCRFAPPKGPSFSINENVTANNSLLSKYYYPSNMSTEQGDCAVVVTNVSPEDEGAWTCGAWIEHNYQEYSAELNLFLPKSSMWNLIAATTEKTPTEGLTTDSIIGFSIAGVVIAILSVMGGVTFCRRRLKKTQAVGHPPNDDCISCAEPDFIIAHKKY